MAAPRCSALRTLCVHRSVWVRCTVSTLTNGVVCRGELVAQYLVNGDGNADAGLPMLTGKPNVTLMMGIQSQNCTENPTFCQFNQAQLMMCDCENDRPPPPPPPTRVHTRHGPPPPCSPAVAHLIYV